MVTWETSQPPKEQGDIPESKLYFYDLLILIGMLDVKQANSKYYNPHHFDP